MANRISRLPARPSLESLKRQAKALLHAYRRAEPEALDRVRGLHPKQEAFRTLRDAQLVVAREYGLRDWSSLREAVELALEASRPTAERIERFMDYACLHYIGEDSIRRRELAARMLEVSPELAERSVHAAAAAGHVAALRRHLADDSSCVDRRGGPRDWVPLMYLCYSRIGDAPPSRDAVGAARVLLEAGADPNAHAMYDIYRFTALTGAAGEGEGGLQLQPPHAHARELALLLLEAGADPNDSQALYNTHFSDGNEWIELLLGHGLTAADRANWLSGDDAIGTLDYLLGQAVASGLDERVELLLAHGADPNGCNFYDERRHYESALVNGHPELAERLLDGGATAFALSRSASFRAACMAADEPRARALLAADPALVDEAALLFDAISRGSDAAVRLVLALGVSLDAREPSMQATPLHRAALLGRTEIVELMLDAGAEIDARDGSVDSTAVSWANHGGHAELCEALLDRSRDVFDLATFGRVEQLRALLTADPSAATRRRANGFTPLHRLETPGERGAEVVDLLLTHGADPNARADDGATPLAIALEVDDDVAELLRERGAEVGATN